MDKFYSYMACILFGMVREILEEARENGLQKVFYLSREGNYLCKVHEIVRKKYDSYALIEPVHLEVSRLSIILPSLQDVTDERLHLIDRKYRCTNLIDYLRGLGLPIDTIVNDKTMECCLNGLSNENYINGPHALQALMKNEVFKTYFNSYVEEQKRLLRKYLLSRIGKVKNIMVCDIGWRGTIQDGIERILPEKNIYGKYLFTFRFGGSKESSSKVSGYFGGTRKENYFNFLKERLFRFVKPVELLISSPINSISRYEVLNGGVVPVYYKTREIDDLIENWADLQDNLLRKIREIGDQNSRRRKLILIVYYLRIIHFPFKWMAEKYAKTINEEVFGSGRVNMPFNNMIAGVSLKEKYTIIAKSGWPAGLVVYRTKGNIKAYTFCTILFVGDRINDSVMYLKWIISKRISKI